MIKALEVSSDIDLSAFVRFLRDQGVNPHVTEEGLNQVLWAGNDAEATLIKLAFEQYQQGEFQIEPAPGMAAPKGTGWQGLIRRFPLTLSLIAINIVLFPVGMGFSEETVGWLFRSMMFQGLQEIAGDYYFVALAESLGAGEWWRLLTPMFIHFSWLHIVFNLLWVWEIGRRIEVVNSTLMLLGVVVITSVASNVTQYLMAGPGLFGGMSGVVFGLLGHSLIWSRLVPSRNMGVASGIYIFMLVYLAVGFTGAIDLLGLGKLANGAHLGGLLAGLITGTIAGLIGRSRSAVQ